MRDILWSIIVIGAAPRLARYEDLLTLDEDVRAEIFGGEIAVSPAPRPRHSKAQRALGNFVGGPFDDDDGFGGPGGWWILEGDGDAGDLVLSTQVLQEFHVAVTRKLKRPLAPRDAAAAIDDLAKLPIVQIDLAMVVASIADCQKHQLSLWDTLVLNAALSAGCDQVLTEDLQHGFRFGSLRVENPFR